MNPSKTTRPNVLIIHTDEQATWTIGAHGGTLCKTPHLDRIGREGAICNQAYVSCAVCTPSRGSLLTGRYPISHGAYINNKPLNEDEITLAELFKQAGYQTSYIGKWHLDGARRPGWVIPQRGFGFDDTQYMFNRGHWKRIEEWPGVDDPTCFPYQEIGDENTYTTDYLANACVKRLSEIQGDRTQQASTTTDKPFFMMLSIPDPHTPYSVRNPYSDQFPPDAMTIPENFNDQNLPSWGKASSPYSEMNEEAARRVRKHKAAYLGMVACIDDNVGRILQHLETLQILDQTIILFTSDHGNYIGEHGMNGKNKMYKSAYQVPFLIRYPQSIPAGTVINNSIDNTDVLPTLCSLAGVKTSGRECGEDLSQVLAGTQTHADKPIYQHHYSHQSGFSLCGIISRYWHLILHQGGEHRLFNLKNDPHELNDCFDAYPDQVKSLRADITAHHQKIGSPAYQWLQRLEFNLRSIH